MIQKASTGLGMSFSKDPVFIEIPSQNDLLNDGFTK
jgi:hypothetical protein